MRCVSLVLGATLALSSFGCSNFFYFPSRKLVVPKPEWIPDAELETHTIPTYDGERLSAWRLVPRNGEIRGTFVQFHGNAGSMSNHLISLYWVVERGFALFTFDYRGYGRSSGRPSQRGLYLDGLAALAFAEQLPRGEWQQDLILYGQSLGGAVLLRSLPDARRTRVRAVVVEGSFHSYEEIAASVAWRTPVLFPFGGLSYVAVSDEYAPAAYVERVSPIPLLIIHAERDPVIPVAFGHALYALARPPKAFLGLPSDRHIGAWRSSRARRAIESWVERALDR